MTGRPALDQGLFSPSLPVFLFNVGKLVVVIKRLSSFKVLRLSGLVLVLGCAGTTEADPGWRDVSGLWPMDTGCVLSSATDELLGYRDPVGRTRGLDCSPGRKLWWGNVLTPVGWWTPLRCVGHFLPSLHSLWHGGGCNGPFHLYPHLCEYCNGYRRPIYLLFERDVFLEQANSVFFQFDCLINAVLLAY